MMVGQRVAYIYTPSLKKAAKRGSLLSPDGNVKGDVRAKGRSFLTLGGEVDLSDIIGPNVASGPKFGILLAMNNE